MEISIRTHRRAFAVMTGMAFCLSAFAAADEASARADIRAIYTFSPHLLTSEQIAVKSKVLDGVWARAKAQSASYVLALRSELARPDAQPFFLYDGSALLLSLSDTSQDRRVALAAIGRCDLRDVQPTAYLRQVHRLATLGEDTTDAALHILTDPKFTAFIPQHALTLGQNYSLIYMLMPLDAGVWLPRLLARLSTESEPTALKSLLLLSWYAQTKEADEAIAAFAANRAKPGEARLYAQQLMARATKPGLLDPGAGGVQSEESIRASRREIMKRLSDEALIELDQATMRLMAKRKGA